MLSACYRKCKLFLQTVCYQGNVNSVYAILVNNLIQEDTIPGKKHLNNFFVSAFLNRGPGSELLGIT